VVSFESLALAKALDIDVAAVEKWAPHKQEQHVRL
jgi:hypothetical protein